MANYPTVGALELQNAVSISGTDTVTGAKTFSGNNTYSGISTFSGTQIFSGLKVGQKVTTVADDATLAATDCGSIQNVTVDAKTVTLPATAVGLVFTIRNGGADGAVLVTVSPNANDKIQGIGFSAADNKDALNTKATAKQGDFITLLGDGVDGWFVVDCVGTWVRE